MNVKDVRYKFDWACKETRSDYRRLNAFASVIGDIILWIEEQEKENTNMSWSISIKVVPKSAIGQALEDLSLADTGMVPSADAVDQLETAKRGALEILKGIPGPYVSVSLSGHSNGVGWQKKGGYADDFITVNVYQRAEAPEEKI